MEDSDVFGLNGKLLRLFLVVYETQSVSKAAAELGLNQSTISYSLDKIRDALDDPLFIASGRGIAPTETAINLVPKVRQILIALEELSSDKNYIPSNDTNPISIAANVLEQLPLCDKIRRKISDAAPRQELRFIELGSRENVKPLLDSHKVDAVISVRPMKIASSTLSMPLYSSIQVCFYDSDMRGPIDSVADYCNAKHAVLDFGGNVKSTIESTLESMTLERTVALSVPNVTAMARMIKGTDLICTMQRSLADHAFSELSFCKPPIFIPDINIDLTWHRSLNQSGRNLWLRNQIISAAQD